MSLHEDPLLCFHSGFLGLFDLGKLVPDLTSELELQTIANLEHTHSSGVGRKLNECEFKKHVLCAPFMKKFPL